MTHVEVRLELEVGEDVWMHYTISMSPVVLAIQNVIVSLSENKDSNNDSIFDEFRIDSDTITYRRATLSYEVFVHWVPGEPDASVKERIKELEARGWKISPKGNPGDQP